MNRQELHNEMVKIVDQIVERYQNDFYEIDVEVLDRAEVNNRKHFVWIPRTNGTFLIPVDNAVGMENWFDAIMQNFRGELSLYEVYRNGNEWKILPSCENRVREAFNRELHFDMQVFNEWGNEIWSDIGLFDNRELANKKASDIMCERRGKYYSVVVKEA